MLAVLAVVLAWPAYAAPVNNGRARTAQVPAAACDSLLVIDFISDAEGRSLTPGELLGTQYRLWGVGITAASDGQPSSAEVAEVPSATGPFNAARVSGGRAGTLRFEFHNLLSVQAVEIIGLTSDGASVSVYDQNSQQPAWLPVTAQQAGELRAVDLAVLGAATRLDVQLPSGSAVASVVLCPESSPKPVPKNNFPQVAVTATASQIALTAGETARVNVRVENPGGSVGFDLTVRQDLPPGMVFADDGKRERTWEIGAIGARGSFTLVPFEVRATSDEAQPQLTSYVTAHISIGRGRDGAASAAIAWQLTPGKVLGIETSQPLPPPTEPVAPVLPVPAPKPPQPKAMAKPKVAPPAAPAPAPAATMEKPIGGPLEDSAVMKGKEAEGVATTTEADTTIPVKEEAAGSVSTLASPSAYELATATATTTAGAVTCTSWIWLLALINAILITLFAFHGRQTGAPTAPGATAGQGQNRWVVSMLAAAVPLIIWYPACELVWWLALTAAGTGAVLAMTYRKKNPGEPSSGAYTHPPPLPPADGSTAG